MLKEAFAWRQSSAEPNRTECKVVTSRERPIRLSWREIDILKRLVHGDSNKQIGRRLDVSEMTVKVHVKAILRKVRARNRTQAAIWGVDHLPDVLGAEAEIVSDASSPHGPLSEPAKTISGSGRSLATRRGKRRPQ
jgi:two-component system nitrate/nitrite response regulator NarL